MTEEYPYLEDPHEDDVNEFMAHLHDEIGEGSALVHFAEYIGEWIVLNLINPREAFQVFKEVVVYTKKKEDRHAKFSPFTWRVFE